jgi:putative acetyltransferase
MSAAQIPAFHLRSRDGSAEESLVLAGIWRRAWIAAHRNASVVEPITHWLRRVQAEFIAPADVVLAEREGQALAFMVLLRGAVDHHPASGRERVAYHWHPPGPVQRHD